MGKNCYFINRHKILIVRDHKGMGCNVALIECTWVRENPKGVGVSEGRVQGARWGTGGVSLRATWD
jgi:hypothetical protein